MISFEWDHPECRRSVSYDAEKDILHGLVAMKIEKNGGWPGGRKKINPAFISVCRTRSDIKKTKRSIKQREQETAIFWYQSVHLLSC